MLLSDEQNHIIDELNKGKNVIVCAVAGSGKSSTVLSAAAQMPDRQFIQVTYNASLRLEIKEKVEQLCLTNIEIHTYHSLAVRYYLPNCFTDAGLRRILYNNIAPRDEIALVDVLVIDEAQDMTLLYYQLIQKYIRDMLNNSAKIQLLILGDELQSLYEFKGSDARFLTLAEKIWSGCSFLRTNEFSKCTMKMSYRITDQICAFVNDVMIGQQRMNSCRSDEPVKYVRNSRTNLEKTVVFEINRLLAAGAKPSDFFILGASVKSTKSVVRKMENVLVSQGIPCYVPMMENENIDDRVIEGKIVFSTFHSVKGRQRPYVFIVGFDNSYFEFYARTLPTDRCPNTLYVGATRASKALFLLEGDNFAGDRPLPFLKMSHHEMRAQPYIQFKGQPRSIFYADERTVPESINLIDKHFETPTSMIKFIPESVIEEISPIIDRIFVREQVLDNGDFDIPAVIRTKGGFHEEVSDLNGVAIPAMYYDKLTNRYSGKTDSNILLTIIKQTLNGLKSNEHTYLRELVDGLDESSQNIADYLYLANIYVATQEKLYFKLKQVGRDEYGWLSSKHVENCLERLESIISQEYPPETQKNYNNFSSRNPITEKGKELEYRRAGGGKESEYRTAGGGKELEYRRAGGGKELEYRRAGGGKGEPGVPPSIEETILSPTMEEEHKLIDAALDPFFENKKFRFTARTDIITPKTVWELKCTSKISIDHLLQVVIYAWLWTVTRNEEKDFKILNIKTGEIMRLSCSRADLDYIVVSILQGKYLEHEPISDDDFIRATR